MILIANYFIREISCHSWLKINAAGNRYPPPATNYSLLRQNGNFKCAWYDTMFSGNNITGAAAVLFITVFLSVRLQAGDILTFPRAVLTEKHFQLQTDIPAEQIEMVTTELESLYAVWHNLFGNDVKTEQNIKHRVRIFRNKNEYVLHLRRFEPDIAKTNGYYSPQTRTAYFFFDHDDFRKTLLHEVTHQLFGEIWESKGHPAGNNYWLVEGIALFMETLHIQEKQYTLGDITDNRLYAAKVYYFERHYRLPVEKLVTLTATDILHSKDIVKIYDQSAALVHLLFFAEKGKYRPAILQLLREVYSGKAETNSLQKLTHLNYRQIDEMYETFLQTVPD
jgi:hypothetical protein